MSERATVEGEGGGIKAKFASKFKKRPEDSPEKKKQQLQDYTAWVNNYLKRKPGAPLVSDLRRDLGDGVIFVHLVEVVAKVQVTGVERWPATAEGQRLNIERSLEFLRGDGVMLHSDASRDLLDGNVKGVMKVILAIAERYQPKSVKPRTEPLKPTVNHTATLSENQFSSRQEFPRPFTHPQVMVRPESFHTTFSSYPPDPSQEAVYSSPIDTLPAHKPPQVISSRKKAAPPPVVVSRGRGVGGKFRINEETIGDEMEGELSGDIGAVVSGLSQFKAELLQLHAILLRNNDGTCDVGGGVEGGERERGERDNQREMVSLQERLSHLQDELTQTEAECAALRTMVEERNAFITTMKSEIYRKEYLNDTQKAELHTQLLQKDTHIKKLETELVDCHGNLEGKGSELERIREELDVKKTETDQTRTDMEQLQTELNKVSASEEKLSQRLSAKEKKLLSLEEKMSEERERMTRRNQQISEDMESLSEGLSGLTSDPRPEQLEIVRKKMAETISHLEQPEPSSPSRRRKKDRETDDHISKHRRKKRGQPTAESASPNTTRILYHIAGDSKTDTPFVAIVTKRASEVTLKDFKEAFGRHGNYRFFFKNEDPDCGVVKEELTVDDQILPSYRGKVIAWIQEKEKSST